MLYSPGRKILKEKLTFRGGDDDGDDGDKEAATNFLTFVAAFPRSGKKKIYLNCASTFPKEQRGKN